jgi:ribosomal protein S18 acetylase RimI-like enzyme
MTAAASEADLGSAPAVLGFRPAMPEDADVAVPLIYSSGPASFDYVFGAGRAQAFLRHAFEAHEGEFSHRTHEVALLRGHIAAVGAVFDGRAALAFTLAAARQILKFYGPVAGIGVIVRGLRTEGVIRPPKPKELYLAHLGVLPALRGVGIGTRLVEALLLRRDPAWHELVALDVAVTNPRAEALYARMGFEVAVLRRSRLRNRDGAVADHRRMVLR